MDKYEILYIIRSDVEDDRKNAIVEKFENLVGTLGGTVETLDKWEIGRASCRERV